MWKRLFCPPRAENLIKCWQKWQSFEALAGQIRGQMSVCRAWNALPNNVEHKVEAIMEPFRSPAGDRTWVIWGARYCHCGNDHESKGSWLTICNFICMEKIILVQEPSKTLTKVLFKVIWCPRYCHCDEDHESKRRPINNFLPLSNFICMGDAVLQKARTSPIYLGELG